MAGNSGAQGGSLRVIGKPLRKVDATSKCTGQTKYADDFFFPRMLHTKLLRSTVPHARIVRILWGDAGERGRTCTGDR